MDFPTPGKGKGLPDPILYLQNLWANTLNIPVDVITKKSSLSSLSATPDQILAIQTALQGPPWEIKHYPSTPFLTWTLKEHVNFLEGRIEKFHRDEQLKCFEHQPDDKIPLSFPQEQIWFQLQDSPSPSIYNYGQVFHFPGPINVEAIHSSFTRLVQRHQAVDVTFHEEGGKIFQRSRKNVPIEFKVLDLKNLSESSDGEVIKKCREFLYENLVKPFNLQTGPCCRFAVILVSPELSTLHVVAHHIIADGTTGHMQVLEVKAHYDTFCNNTPSVLPPVEIQYFDYVLWQRTLWANGAFAPFQKFWAKYLENLSPLDLERDGPRIPSVGMPASNFKFNWSTELALAIREFASKLKVTPFVILLSAINILLGRYSRQTDISILTAKHGRTNSKLRNIIGHFVNTIAVRTHLKPEISFLDLVQETDISLTYVYENQEYPFQHVIQDLVRESKNESSFLPYLLFPVCIVMIPKVVKPKALEELTSYFEVENNLLTHELTFNLEEGQGSLAGFVKYNSAIHSHARIEQMVLNLETLLENALKNPTEKIQSIQMFRSTQIENILKISTGSKVPMPIDGEIGLIQQFENQVNKTPANLAIIEGNFICTYSELNDEANTLSCVLISHLQPMDLFIAILIPQSTIYIRTSIAILKTGKIVVPLSIQNSSEYLEKMLEGLDRPLLVSTSEIIKNLKFDNYSRIFLLDKQVIIGTSLKLMGKSQLNSIAYCIHTSGSTGFPKPVNISHSSLTNHARWARHELKLTERDRVLVFNNVSFDASLQDIWPFLLTGASLCIPLSNLKYEPAKLWEFISTNGVTCLTLPTAIADKVVSSFSEDMATTSLRIMLVGGEHFHSWRPGLPFEIVNGYGLTECCVISTFVFQNEQNVQSSGSPIWNTGVYVLDDLLHLVPIGVTGEIYISGAGISMYWNQDQLNQEKFIPCPFSDSENNLMCKTGDLGYWRFDGNLCVTGRKDQQIKVRGHRVELSGIEEIIMGFPNILETVVLLQGDSLSAFCRMNPKFPDPPGFHEFQSFLTQRLPQYAVPSKIFILTEDLPLNSNGKIDRKIFESMVKTQMQSMTLLCPDFTPVECPEEIMVSKIWAEVLGLPEDGIGRDDNFFGLGGHSLLVADVVFRLQEEPCLINSGINLQLEDLFKEPTVAGFAKVIKAKLAESAELEIQSSSLLPPIIPKSDQTAMPNQRIQLSFQQEQIWLHMQENSEWVALYNETFSLEFSGDYKEDVIRKSVQIIQTRHSILRSNYEENKGDIYFFVQEKTTQRFAVKNIDLTRLRLPKTHIECISQQILHSAHRKPFNLQKGNLLRWNQLKITNALTRVQVIFHHLIMDAIGIIIFEKELRNLYQNGGKGSSRMPLPQVEFQYSDFALWQRQEYTLSYASKFEEASKFWKEFLSGVEPLDIFPHKQRNLTKTNESGSFGINLTSALTKKIKEFCAQKNTTVFVTLLTTLKLLIYRYSGQTDICTACTTSGRNRSNLDYIIGYFVNAVIFRNDLSGNPTFEELVGRVHSNQNKVLKYQDYPFQNVMRDSGLKLSQELNRLGVTMEPRNLNDAASAPSFFFEQIDYHTKFELTVCFDECETNIMIYFVYSRDVYLENEIQAMAAHFQELLQDAMNRPSERVNNLNLLTPQEAELVISSFNQKRPQIPLPPEGTSLIHLLQEQVEETPENIAIVENGVGMTYAEVYGQIYQLKNFLLLNKFDKNEFIALLLPQCKEFLIGSLAILMAGKICVPLSIEFPKKQLEYMLNQVGNPLLITTSAILENVGLNSYPNVFKVDDDEFRFNSEGLQFKNLKLASKCAYCFFTSGSTGQPKAVLVEHIGIINVCKWMQYEYKIISTDRNALLCSPAFDASLAEFWPFLLSGAILYIPPNELRYNVTKLHAWVLKQELTFVFRTSKLGEEFFKVESAADDKKCKIRWFFTGAEPLRSFPPSSLPYRVAYCYGNTETSIMSTVNNLAVDGKGVPSVGYGISNVKIYVLDHSTLLPMPIGIPGEIFIGGIGITPGYLNRESLNAEKIISDPYTTAGKIYKTGDLGYRTPEGELVIIGRKDNQIKIRGIRIGLGQVEDALLQYPGIEQAMVVVHGHDGNSLAAYCIGIRPASLVQLMEYLRKQLPLYAIPSLILFVQAFPFTTTGKVDLKALAAMAELEGNCLSQVKRVPITTPEEKIVAQVWSEILKVPLDTIGAEDNFFSLGGHSLLVGSVITRLQDSPWEVKLQIGDLFKYPTVNSFALVVKSKMEQNYSEDTEIVSNSDPDHLGKSPLSFQQEQIWFHMQETKGTTTLYNETFSLNFHEILDLSLFQRAVQMVVNRHGILNTNFIEEDGEIYQVEKVKNRQSIPIQVVDLSRIKNPMVKDVISRNLLSTSQKTEFKLDSERLFRLHLIKLASGITRLQAISHHLIMDAVSVVIFEKELKNFYQTLSGRNSCNLELARTEVQYSDFAQWQRRTFAESKSNEKSLKSSNFWKEYLTGLEPFALFPKRSNSTKLGNQSGVTGFIISPTSAENITRYARAQNTTTFKVLLAGLKSLIYRYTGQDDIFTLCTTDGRNRPKLDSMIGYFINNVIFRTNLTGHPSLNELVAQVQQTTNSVLEHQDYPFQQIVAEADWSIKESGLYNLAVTMEPRNYRTMDNKSTFFFERIEPVTKFDLLVCFDENVEGGHGIQIGFLYNRNVYEDDSIQRFSVHFKILLEQLLEFPDAPIDSFNFLTEDEIQLTINGFNEISPAISYEKDSTLVKLFLQVANDPKMAENVAIFSAAEENKVTYKKLKQNAIHLAKILGKNTSNKFIAILLPQSVEFITSTLSILMCGKIVVPLSLDQPVQLLEYVLDQLDQPILITSKEVLNKIGMKYSKALFLNNLELIVDELNEEVPAIPYESSAYCLFTSGSTGKPKATVQEHSGIINMATWMRTDYNITSKDRSLLTSNPAFDLSLAEIWPFLLSGATLCIPPEEFRYDIPSLHSWVFENEISFVFLTTKLGEAFISVKIPNLERCLLRWVHLGGEPLHKYPPIESLPYQIIYAYGTTETTIFTTMNKLIPEQSYAADLSVGYSLGNVRVYILDSWTLLSKPIGAIGEICIGGEGVSPGYVHMESNDKFIPDPYNLSFAGGRMYKSGDLGYWLPTGQLVVVGRKDNQVKIRGIRIGLGQIEQALQEFPGISHAEILFEENQGRSELIAFCRSSCLELPKLEILLAYLNQTLPRNAIPSTFAFITNFPLNPIGKIDKKALLRKMDDSDTIILESDHIPPATPEEKLVAQIWSELLSIPIERISTADNFFALGGHSLLLAPVIQRLRRPPWNFQVHMSDLFAQSTLAEFAAKLSNSKTRSTTCESQTSPRALEYLTSFPLSFPQEQIWFHSQAKAQNSDTLYTMAFKIEFVEENIVDLTVLRRSIRKVVTRHQILLSTIHENGGKLYQRINPPDTLLQNLDCIDLTKFQDQDSIAKSIFRESHLESPFDLEKGPLIRFTLLKLADSHVIVLVSCHHSVMDGISIQIFETELRCTYEEMCKGFEDESSSKFQYYDYVFWQRENLGLGLGDEANAFWNDYLKDVVSLQLRTDQPRNQLVRKYKAAASKFQFDSKLSSLIKEFSKGHKVTSFVTILSALKVLLFRYTNQSDILVVSTTDGRSHPDFQYLIGHFINMILIRIVGLDKDLNFTQVVQAVQDSLAKVYKYQDSPLQNVVSQIGALNSMDIHNGLYRFGLTMTTVKGKMGADNLGAGYLDEISEFDAKYEIFLSILETEANYQFAFWYDTDLYTAERMERFGSHFKILMEQVLQSQISIGALNLMTLEEKNLVVQTFNQTKNLPFQNNATLLELFEEQLGKTPQNIAIVTDEVEIDYFTLNAKAESLKNVLENLELVAASDFVGILLPQGINFIVSTIAIFKCGKICVPINVDNLNDSILYSLGQVGNPILITFDTILKSKNLKYQRVFCLDDEKSFKINNQRQCKNKNNDLAYCLCTSGSTGLPKATMITHSGLVNFTNWLRNYLELTSSDRSLVYSSPGFDMSLVEIWGYLFCGATLCIPPSDLRYDLKGLKNWINSKKVTILALTTKVAEELLLMSGADTKENTSVRVFHLGGEIFNFSIQLRPDLPYKLFNLYGVMEASIVSTCTPLVPENLQQLPIIGKPISNVQVYILSQEPFLNPLPVGVTGEICIGGVGVSPGYLNHEELNRQKFVPNPFCDGKLYRTGDLGYWLPSGDVVVVGRIDDQIKIRGLRINLGVVERALRSYPGIAQSVVLLEQEKLTAYVVINLIHSAELPSLNQIIDFLQKSLPQYAIPAKFYVVGKIPLNVVGKVDKSALLAMKNNPEQAARLQTKIIAPISLDEKLIASIWSEILQIPEENISRHDNFFALGGHSLLATQIIHKLSGYDLKVADIFSYPILSTFAAILRERKENFVGSIKPRAIASQEYFPLSFAQEQVWMHIQDQAFRSATLYNMGFNFDFTGHLIDVEALRQSLLLMVERHAILRTTIHEVHGSPQQKIEEMDQIKYFPIEHDFSHLSPSEQNSKCLAIGKEMLNKPFDLKSGPLIKFYILRMNPEFVKLLIFSHHCLMDGTSIQIFVTELKICYDMICSKALKHFEPLPIQYADYAVWQRETLGKFGIRTESLKFWKNYLENLIPLEFQTDCPRNDSSALTSAGSIEFKISAQLTTLLKQFCKSQETTTFAVFFSALVVLIYRYTRQEDMFLISTNNGRTHSELQNMIGHFVNIIIIRVKGLRTNMSFVEVVRIVHDSISQVYSHVDAPFQNVIAQSGLNVKRLGLHRFVITMTHTSGDNALAASGPNSDLSAAALGPKCELGLFILESANDFIFSISYAQPLYSTERIKRFSQHFETLLTELMEPGVAGNLKLNQLNLMSAEERQMILHAFSEPQMAHQNSNEHSLLDLFQKHVEKNPARISLYSDEEGYLSYGELDDRANKLSAVLDNHSNFEENTFIAVLLPTCFDAVISFMAILKLGRTCVPINIRFPLDQIKSMLLNIDNPTIVTTRSIISNIGLEVSDGVILIEEINSYKVQQQPYKVKPNYIPYALFTSGSTGHPKAVLVTETSILNLIHWMCTEFQFSKEDKGLQFYSPSTDAFLGAFWPIIASGGTIFIPPDDFHYNIEELWKWVHEKEITFVGMPTASAEKFYTIQNSSAKNFIKTLCCGGELMKIYPPADLPYDVLNCYGLTETGVISTFAKVTGGQNSHNRIVIGKPVRNTQIYILDEYFNPVCVGLSGELFIGGEGIANGYLKNEELNTEKFVPNPFSTDKKEILFRTGDLGYWLPDGNICLTGRSDNLIKIRSMRIELDEIEFFLLKYPNIKQAAVQVEEDEVSIVAFCVVSNPEERLTYLPLYNFLGDRLPYYALPSAIYIVQNLPLNSNGKIDRKILPSLKASATKLSKLEEITQDPPISAEEIKMTEIWSKILNIPFESIGRKDNFFLLGGNSLMIAEMIAAYNFSSQNSELTVSAIFANPTVEGLAKYLLKLSEESSKTSEIDFDQEILLNVHIDESLTFDSNLNSRILLTGSTGYLGTALLVELLNKTNSLIYCLIRAKDLDPAWTKLELALAAYDLRESAELSKRIICVLGDLAQPYLGIAEDEYFELSNSIGSIYHCAADVHFLKTYKELRSTNVNGTRAIIDFATTYRLKFVHYISTLGVFSCMSENGNNNIEMVSEISLDEVNIDPNTFTSGYTASKWVAEKLIWAGIAKGLPANVYRLGEIGCHGQFDIYNQTDFIATVLKTCNELGYFPTVDGVIPYGNLDFCARAIVDISMQQTQNNVFHIIDHIFTFVDLFKIFNKQASPGVEIQLVSLELWETKFKEFVHESSNHPRKIDESEGSMIRGRNAFLSLLMTRKEFKFPMQKYVIPEIEFSKTKAALGLVNKYGNNFIENDLSRYIRLVMKPA